MWFQLFTFTVTYCSLHRAFLTKGLLFVLWGINTMRSHGKNVRYWKWNLGSRNLPRSFTPPQARWMSNDRNVDFFEWLFQYKIHAGYRILHCLHEYFSHRWLLKLKVQSECWAEMDLCYDFFLSPLHRSIDLIEPSIPIQIFSFPYNN